SLTNDSLDNYTFVSSRAYDVNAINKQVSTNIELPKDFFNTSGVYKAVIQGGNEYYYVSTSTFIISDLGINLRKHQNGTYDIWARSLRTGQPIEGVTARFIFSDASESMGVTDSLGHIKTTALTSKGSLYTLVAEKGTNVAIINLARAMDLSDYDIAGNPHTPIQAYVYGPRDLYRGGETARWNILVRDYDGKLVDPGSIKITLTDPKGEGKDTRNVTIDKEYGYYEYSYNLPANAATGVWKLTTTAGTSVNVHNFSVEDFMPETMRLILGEQGEPLIVSKSKALNLQAHGEYLYGAAASGNSIEGTYDIRPGVLISDKWRGYRFAQDDVANRSSNNYLKDGKLDEDGNISWSISDNATKAIEDKKQPVRIRYFVTLFESGGRAVNRVKEYVYLPTGGAIGIKAGYENFASTDTDTNFSIININAAGEAVRAKVSVTLMRDERSYYWDYNSNTGWRSYFTSAAYPIKTFDTEIGTKPLELPFKLEYGYYKLVVKNLATSQETVLDISAGQYWYDEDGGGSSNVIKPDSLTVTFDRAAYVEGATAKVTISSPYDGQGMLFVETGDGLIWSERITVKNNKATVTMPIAQSWNRHDIYVSAFVARNEAEMEKTQNSLVYGIAHLPIDRQARKIELDMTYPATVEPDTDFEVVIRAKDGAKQAGAMVTLAAVDQGILSLKAFDTPDAWKYFFGKKMYGSVIYDNFWQVIHKYSAAMATRYGGDAGLMAAGGALARADVNIISIFNKPIKLDGKGEARIKLNIPSFNGELRMMAMAFSKDAFGMKEGVMKVAQPIITELSTPRFMATGDQVELALDLRNMTDASQNLTVKVEASAPLALVKGFSQSVALAKGARQVLNIPVQAVGSSGYGEIKVTMSGLDSPKVKTWRVAVRSPYPAITKTVLLNIPANQTAAFFSGGLGAYVKDSAYLSVSVDTIPPLGLEAHFAYLLQYPYGCLEQTVSSTFPLIYASESIRKRYNMSLPRGGTQAELVAMGLDRLYAKQLPSGGFGYWDSSSEESSWASVYATELLNEAKKRGFTVNQARLDSANNRLANYVRRDIQNPYSSYYDSANHYTTATKAYAAYVLSKYSNAPLADIRDVYARYATNAASPVPLLHLAIALKNAGDSAKAQEAFNKATSITMAANRYYGDYSSTLRENAWAIALYTEFDSKNADTIIDMLQALSKTMGNQSWFSTQERLRLFMAAVSMSESAATAIKGSITADGKTESVDAKQYTGVWRAETLDKNIEFKSTNDRTVYARAEFSAYPKQKPAPVSRNASVQRQYYDESGNSLNLANVQAGDFVLVRLYLTVDMNTADGLLVDLLPAGFELENQNLDNSRKLSSFKLPARDAAQVIYSEYRDDRFVAAVNMRKGQKASVYYIMRAVTPGTYANTPPYFEDMYRPSVRAIGQTAPDKIMISGK
ncbi:MAG: hypothetical protein LBV04_06520, partial [Deferribacteraceae bacterium]|nr:hypothetical protein [Deferribacteraceae bacterium]